MQARVLEKGTPGGERELPRKHTMKFGDADHNQSLPNVRSGQPSLGPVRRL